MTLTRRQALCAGLLLPTVSQAFESPSLSRTLTALERQLGGRLGLCALRGQRTLSFRAEQRFANATIAQAARAIAAELG